MDRGSQTISFDQRADPDGARAGLESAQIRQIRQRKARAMEKALTGIHRGDLFQAVWEKAAGGSEKHRAIGTGPDREENGAQGDEGSDGKSRK